jgi:hypothetical protein
MRLRVTHIYRHEDGNGGWCTLVFRSFLAPRWSVRRGDTPVTSGFVDLEA